MPVTQNEEVTIFRYLVACRRYNLIDDGGPFHISSEKWYLRGIRKRIVNAVYEVERLLYSRWPVVASIHFFQLGVG